MSSLIPTATQLGLQLLLNRRTDKPQKLDRLIPRIDVRMGHGLIRTDHVRHSRTLDPQLGPDEGKTGAIDRYPDFLLAGIMRVRLSHRHGINVDRDQISNSGETVGPRKKVAYYVCPMAG